MFGYEVDPHGWMDVDRLVPVAGGGASGRRALGQAVDRLATAGLIDQRSMGGRSVYRRSKAGAMLAEQALAEDEPCLLSKLAVESAFRSWQPEPGAPRELNELIGQEPARHLIRRNLDWAHRTGKTPAGMLLFGPSGSGKTLLGGLISRELGLPFMHISMADATHDDVTTTLALAEDGGVVFMDELHSATRRLKDALLVSLDPAKSTSFVAVGATTHPGLLSAPLRRRFQLEIPLHQYSVSEAETLVRKRADALDLPFDSRVPFLIARAARANPARIAAYLTEAAMLIEGTGQTLTVGAFSEHLHETERDVRGVDAVELEMLIFLRDGSEGPAGLRKLAEAVGLDEGIIRERLCMLRREGLVRNRGRQGHELSADGEAYLRGRSF